MKSVFFISDSEHSVVHKLDWGSLFLIKGVGASGKTNLLRELALQQSKIRIATRELEVEYFDDIHSLNPATFIIPERAISEILSLEAFLWERFVLYESWGCVQCGSRVRAFDREKEEDDIYEKFKESSILVSATVTSPDDIECATKLGFSKIIKNGEVVDIEKFDSAAPGKLHVVLDRFVLTEHSRVRFKENITAANVNGFNYGQIFSSDRNGGLSDAVSIRFRECCRCCGERRSRNEIRKEYFKSFQNSSLISVLEGVLRKNSVSRVIEAIKYIKELGLDEINFDTQWRELKGEEKSRVLILLALLGNIERRVLFLDSPLMGLSSAQSGNLSFLINKILDNSNIVCMADNWFQPKERNSLKVLELAQEIDSCHIENEKWSRPSTGDDIGAPLKISSYLKPSEQSTIFSFLGLLPDLASFYASLPDAALKGISRKMLMKHVADYGSSVRFKGVSLSDLINSETLGIFVTVFKNHPKFRKLCRRLSVVPLLDLELHRKVATLSLVEWRALSLIKDSLPLRGGDVLRIEMPSYSLSPGDSMRWIGPIIEELLLLGIKAYSTEIYYASESH